MTSPNPLDAALKRLADALGSLEAADERRSAAERVRADLEEELGVMQDDRARLAAELDGALASNRSLSLANADVSGRLERAEAMLRDLIASVGQDGAGGHDEAGGEDQDGVQNAAGAR